MPFVFNPFTGNLDSVQSLTFPGTLVVASGKTATINNTLTFSGTDASLVAFGAGGTVLYSGGAVTSIATTSPISGGTITATGTISLLVNVDHAFTAAQSITKTINATSADGLLLANTTSAAAGAQQWSPRLHFTGQGWKTTSTAASQTVDWIVETVPLQGGNNPTSQLSFSSQVNGAGYTQRMYLDNAGFLNVSSQITAGNNVIIPTTSYFGFGAGASSAGIFSPAASQIGLYGASGSISVTLGVDANNSLGIRSSTFAQRFNIYNTFATVLTAAEWFKLDWQGTANQFRMGAVAGSSSGTNRAASWDYGDKLASATAAITVPATSGNIAFGGGLAFGSNLAISNAVPTISSGFGSGATIAGIAGGFRITCGITPGTGGTVAFNTTYANAPVCFVQDETTGVLGVAAPTTTTVVISGLTLLSGQTIAVLVFGY